MQEQDVTPGFEIAVAGSNDSATARFWRKVQVTRDCWLWLGAPSTSGYGRFRVGGTGSPTISAHVVSYRASVGKPLGERGVDVHHECGTRMCVRPDHLREMDRSEHMALHHKATREKPECVNGHDLTNSENVYRWKGVRHCKVCKRMEARLRLGIPYDKWKIKDEV